jgi:hypothetical protein
MNIIVETNFILEIALQQREVEQAEAIVKLAEAEQIELAIPAFSFVEAHLNFAAQSKRRNDLHSRLISEMNQIARSRTHAELMRSLKIVSEDLSRSMKSATLNSYR